MNLWNHLPGSAVRFFPSQSPTGTCSRWGCSCWRVFIYPPPASTRSQQTAFFSSLLFNLPLSVCSLITLHFEAQAPHSSHPLLIKRPVVRSGTPLPHHTLSFWALWRCMSRHVLLGCSSREHSGPSQRARKSKSERTSLCGDTAHLWLVGGCTWRPGVVWCLHAVNRLNFALNLISFRSSESSLTAAEILPQIWIPHTWDYHLTF